MDRITEVTRECLDALIQIRRLPETSLPAPDALHQRLRSFVDAMFQKAAQAGFSREDANDIAYAVVALADELALSRAGMQQLWADNSLQLHYFHENVAGDAFFTRLQGLRRDPRRREVLQVYYLALLLGFQGRYRVRGGELELLRLVEELEREFQGGRRFDAEVISPGAERPDEGRGLRGRGSALPWIALGVLVLMVLLYAGLRLAVGASADSVVRRIESVKPA